MFLGGGVEIELVAVVGLILLVGGPLVGGMVGEAIAAYAEESGDAAAADPIEELRERYARGEIGHEEFERRVERLLETEGVQAEAERSPAADELEPELE